MNSTEYPLVSIVTPSYNQASYLERTIRSVLLQSYPRIEYIVVDGGSTDESKAIIEKYDHKISRWVSEADVGQSSAINKGFRWAKGEIVAWLNSDDVYMAGAIPSAVNRLQKYPEVGMVYGDGILIGGDDQVLDFHHYRTFSALDLLSFHVLLQPTVFLRRRVMEEVGLLDEGYDLIMDHDYWIRFASRTSLLHVPEFWAAERSYPEAKTMASADLFVEEATRLVDHAFGSEDYASIIEGHRKEIEANLAAFSARRMIDARQYDKSLGYFYEAWKEKPNVVIRYWYKVIQAFIGVVKLETVFLNYRNFRRRFQHRGKSIGQSSVGFVVQQSE